MPHHHQHAPGRNRPAAFQGRSSRFYNLMARYPLRHVYRRIAADAARAAPEGGAVLDIGTGPGMLLVELARRRPDLRLAGIDLSADMAALAGRNLARYGGRATVRAADVTSLPFPDGSFDLAVSSFSLHHWDEPEAAVPELARVLRPGGRLVVYDFGFAPFDALAGTARERDLFTGTAPEHTRFRSGLPFGRCARYTMAAPGSPGTAATARRPGPGPAEPRTTVD